MVHTPARRVSMNISAELFSSEFSLLLNIFACAILLLALFFINWKQLFSTPSIQHVVGFCSIALLCVWLIRAGISEGLGIHFFLITAVHLLLGWQLAVWTAAFAMLGTIAAGAESFSGFGINMLVSVITPLLTNYCVWKLHDRSSLNNPFSFIFLVACLGAACSVVTGGLAMSLILLGNEIYPLDTIVNQFWIYVPLIALPEATINGLIITVLIVYVPEWVRLFDTKRYYGDRFR